MANNGFNFIRLRTFVCPSCPGGYNSRGFCDDKHTVTMAKRVKACGMGLFLDFHMSDTWVSLGTGASASAQPSAWKGMTPSQMQQAAYDYTHKVVQELADAGATPDMVQIGNETNAGMSGIPISNWTVLSALIEAGIKGVRDVNPQIGIWVQNGRPRPDSAGGNNFTGWVDTYLGSKGTKLDIDGVCGSTYGTTNSGADWIESFSYVINTWKKPVLSCEYTVASPDNNAGQIINTKVMRGFANHMGLGSFIWEPTRYPNVNQNTLFTKSGNTYTTNAAMSAYPALAKSYGLPVPSNKCVGSQYVY
jgi:arabinogalactan endo-1,4-beta-galactosidase